MGFQTNGEPVVEEKTITCEMGHFGWLAPNGHVYCQNCGKEMV